WPALDRRQHVLAKKENLVLRRVCEEPVQTGVAEKMIVETVREDRVGVEMKERLLIVLSDAILDFKDSGGEIVGTSPFILNGSQRFGVGVVQCGTGNHDCLAAGLGDVSVARAADQDVET